MNGYLGTFPVDIKDTEFANNHQALPDRCADNDGVRRKIHSSLYSMR